MSQNSKPAAAPVKTCSVEQATKFATFLYNCYRQAEADNATTMMDVAVAIFVGYPEEVVRGVCSPTSGLPVKCQFPPNAYEISQECERRMKPLRDAEALLRRREAERAEGAPVEISDEERLRRKAFIAEWREQMAIADARLVAEAGGPLHLLDARKCKGELKELVQGALEGHLANLQREFRENPPQASPALLAQQGIVPSDRDLGNAPQRPPATPAEPAQRPPFDDNLPI